VLGQHEYLDILHSRAFNGVQVVDHYDNPRNVGSFNKNDEDVGTGLVGAPACGDVMKLQLRVRLVVPCPLRSAGTGFCQQSFLGRQLGTLLVLLCWLSYESGQKETLRVLQY
jgi:NifU-like N terminal domain